jgi:hypothetical protein
MDPAALCIPCAYAKPAAMPACAGMTDYEKPDYRVSETIDPA